MGVAVLILGESGSGKSASLRNFKQEDVGILNVASKPLPFRNVNKLQSMNKATYTSIKGAVCSGKKLSWVVDDAQYLMAFIMQHIDTDENGKVKAKTLGKMLDQQLTVEGLFSIVLLCKADERKHYFITQSDGLNPCKSPMGMFDSLEIDNDLKMVDDTIREYYGLKKASAPKAKSTAKEEK